MEKPHSKYKIIMDVFVDVMHAFESTITNAPQGNAKSKHAWDISGHM